MVLAAALAGSVAPITSRYFAMAFSPSSTCTTTGPDTMKSTSSPKNGRALVHRVELLRLLARDAHALLRDDAQARLLDHAR